MSVKILVGTPTYNKAPTPAKTPSAKLFPTVKVIENATIWISIPIPDKLHLNVRLSPDHFASWYKPDDPHEYGRMLMHALASGQVGKVLHNKYSKDAQLSTQVQVDIANLGAPVFFSIKRTTGDPEGPHTLSIQMNPARLGQAGNYEFLDRLHLATEKRLLVGSMLSDARLSRLDVAVDIVGLPLTEILVSAGKAKIEGMWRKSGGDLETISMFRVKKKKSGAIERGALVATAYDKRAEWISRAVKPLHDPAPVVRIEVSKTSFGNKPAFLQTLAAIPNPLGVVAVGLVRSALKPVTRDFRLYAMLRRVCDSTYARGLLSLTAKLAEQYEMALIKHPADLIDGSDAWKGWNAGIQETGTNFLLEAASTKSTGVPLPDVTDLAA